jgi:hypothetical protein
VEIFLNQTAFVNARALAPPAAPSRQIPPAAINKIAVRQYSMGVFIHID